MLLHDHRRTRNDVKWFIAGIEQRSGFGAISRARTFLFAGFGVFDVEPAATLAAVEDESAFHNFGFLSESYESVRGLGCLSDTKRAANPVFASDDRLIPG